MVLAVNGQPVNTLSDVYRLYRKVRDDGQISTVQLDLERQGQPMTKVYRIR